MQSQKIHLLNKEQIQTTMTNWFNIMGLSDVKTIKSEAHPSFSDENIKQYDLPHITKFAKFYSLYSTMKDKKPLFFFVIESDRFDVLHLRACVGWWHLIKAEVHDEVYPQVFICPAYVVTNAMKVHIPINIFPCLYRVVSLCEIYPRIGSKTNVFGLSYDLKLMKDHKEFEDYEKELPAILDSDVDVKILNAIPGDIISCKRIIFDEFPYGEFYFRKVESTITGISSITPGGLCFGNLEK